MPPKRKQDKAGRGTGRGHSKKMRSETDPSETTGTESRSSTNLKSGAGDTTQTKVENFGENPSQGGSQSKAVKYDVSQTRGALASLSSHLTDPSWKARLEKEFSEKYFKDLEATLKAEYAKGEQIFPPKNLIFHAFHLTPFDKVKVVILGQDPYHDDGQACGLSFSVNHSIKIPPSLNNIYKELVAEGICKEKPTCGNLEKWTKEGVFLLNAALTVRAHEANSHAKIGWHTFTDSVIRILSQEASGLVFILWGGFAHKKEKLIDLLKHRVIKTAHPSPLSLNKFMNCMCFTNANKELQALGKTPVNWKL